MVTITILAWALLGQPTPSVDLWGPPAAVSAPAPAPPTPPVFNRFDQVAIQLLRDEATGSASRHVFAMDGQSRRRAVEEDLKSFAATRLHFTPLWKPGELAMFGNIADDACKPFDDASGPPPARPIPGQPNEGGPSEGQGVSTPGRQIIRPTFVRQPSPSYNYHPPPQAYWPPAQMFMPMQTPAMCVGGSCGGLR